MNVSYVLPGVRDDGEPLEGRRCRQFLAVARKFEVWLDQVDGRGGTGHSPTPGSIPRFESGALLSV